MPHSYSTVSRYIYPHSRLCECVFECACSVEWLCSHHSSVDRQFVNSMVTGSCSENGHRLDELCGHATPSVKHTFTHTQNTHQCTHNKHKLNQYRKKTDICQFWTFALTNITVCVYQCGSLVPCKQDSMPWWSDNE